MPSRPELPATVRSESRGICGQFLWIDPAADTVIVKRSSLPKALEPGVTRDHHRAFASVTAALA